MEFPVYLRLGPWSLHPHWVFEFLAYAVGFRIYLRLRRKQGDPVSAPVRWSVIAAAAAGAALGSKVLYWFEDPWATLAQWRDPAYLLAGKTIIGGLIGGLIAVELTKLDGKVVPLTGMIEAEVLINGGRNTIVYEQDEKIREGVFKLFATNHSPRSGAGTLRDLLCCLPRLAAPPELSHENIFRILIVQFIDAYSFDVRSVKKTCIHIVHPDGRLIPFDTYNLFYRDDLEKTRLAPLRREQELMHVE